MLDVLHQRPAAAFGRLNDALLLGLLQAGPEDKVDRGGDTGDDDGKGAKPPTPVDVQQELFGGLGSRKGGNHVRRRGEGESNATVPEVGDVGCEDAEDVVHASKSDGIEDLPISMDQSARTEYSYICGAVSLNVLGRRHHD